MIGGSKMCVCVNNNHASDTAHAYYRPDVRIFRSSGKIGERRLFCARRCRFCKITMASVLKETVGLYETLKTEWNKKNSNLNKCGEILSKLKVLFLTLC